MKDFLKAFAFVVLFGLLALGCVRCNGASVTLMWEPSPDSNAVGYAVYFGTVGTPTPTRNDVGNVTNAPVNNLQPGFTYFFYVTAYDSARNESDPSNVINYTVPTNWIQIVVDESSDITGPWFVRYSHQVFWTNIVWSINVFDLISPQGSAVTILKLFDREVWREVCLNGRQFYRVTVIQ